MSLLVKDEALRLEALSQYEVLNSAPDAILDDLVRLAARTCDTTVAAISLIDADRLWLRARFGLRATELSLGSTACETTILGDTLYEIVDARVDPDFAPRGLHVDGREFHFYAGVPLTTPGGVSIGSLFVLDEQPRRLSQTEAEGLTTLARLVIARLELNSRVRQIDRAARSRQRVENALTVERNFVSAVLDTVGALVVVFDTAGRIVRFNRACELASGYDFNILVGRYAWDRLIPDEDVDDAIATFGKLRAGGLPEDLTYLALVESGYDVDATSRVRAVGMWQFMAETARDVGLRVDWWVDERRDPVRSTDAAVRTLRWLKGQFGSYFVAAAAYNGGPGRVSRGLAQLASVDSAGAVPAGDAQFFALAEHDVLHDETKNYVPQLIAAALVGKEASRYAMHPSTLPPLAYDEVRVPALTPLAAVAAASGATRADLLDLNPHLLRGMTPPGTALLVRVPAGQGAAAAERFAALGAEMRQAFRGAVTRKRESWAALAERVGTPRVWLERFNGGLATIAHGKNRGRLASGQTVRVPTSAVLAYARNVPSDGGGPGALPVVATLATEERAEVPTVRTTSVSSGDVSGEVSRDGSHDDARDVSTHHAHMAATLARVVRADRTAHAARAQRAQSAARAKANVALAKAHHHHKTGTENG